MVQVELSASSEREKELSAQIAELRRAQEEQSRAAEEKLDSLRAELSEYTSGLSQRDNELQVPLMPDSACLEAPFECLQCKLIPLLPRSSSCEVKPLACRLIGACFKMKCCM